MTTPNINNLPQTQQNIQKYFFQQLQPGDFIDAKYTQKEWKLAKVIDKENRYLTIMFDGHQGTQQIYMHSFKVNCLRTNTMGYTGPIKGHHSSFFSIPQLTKQIKMIETIMNTKQPPSAYKVTQYLRGQLFVGINSLLLSDLNLNEEQTNQVYKFLLRVMQKIMKICIFTKENAQQYFESQAANKLLYFVNYKLAIIYSLQELLSLVYSIISPELPKLLKTYKNEIPQDNLISHQKQYIQDLINIFHINDGNGRWMPTQIRIQAIKILIRFKKQDQLTFSIYELKDYQQFHNFWPWVLKYHPSQKYEDCYIAFMIKALINATPFDAKLKSLQILRKVVEKQIKFVYLSSAKIVDQLMKKQVLETLLNPHTFNPQIMKRYIPIIQLMYTNYSVKKYILNSHLDSLFMLMKNRHESQVNTIQQIVVNIAQFITLQQLDFMFSRIQNQIDINTQSGIKFIRQFTLKAVTNYNSNVNRGILGAIFGRKKCSSKYGFYGLNMLWKQMHDGTGKIKKPLLDYTINSVGMLFQNQSFSSEKHEYMQSCVHCIEKKSSFGQCIRILKEIVKSFPPNSFLGDNQASVIEKFDEKYNLLDTFIKALKGLQKEKEKTFKCTLSQSLKYFYEFLEDYEENLKYSLKIEHIEYLWKHPHIFDYLRKVKDMQNFANGPPQWKKKYYKKTNPELMKEILSKIVVHEKNLYLNAGFFDSLDELFISYNFYAKLLDVTERSTIRYKSIKGLAGLEFYYKFLQKILKEKVEDKELFRKVASRIIEIHLRPLSYEDVELKCVNWRNGLMNLMKILKQDAEKCLYVVEKFLQQIKGRSFKDITASGTMDILVSYNSIQKTVNIPRNATIFKLRKQLMNLYAINWNFTMYNSEMKRQISYAQEEDFSVNAMSYKFKGPSIYIRKVEEGVQHPHIQAKKSFMNLLQNQSQFYEVIFGLLTKTQNILNGKEVQHNIWKLIERLPTNQEIIKKIQNCSNFESRDWEQFLQAQTTDQLQYSLKIIYELMANSDWTYDLQKTKGIFVLERLYIKIFQEDTVDEKTLSQLSKIHLKVFQIIKVNDLQKQNASQIIQNIMSFMQKLFKKDKFPQNSQDAQKFEIAEKIIKYKIQTINMLLRYLIISWKKIERLDQQSFIKFLKTDDLLINIALYGLFLPKQMDTSYFAQEIIETFFLKLFKLEDKKKLLQEMIKNYLQLNFLLTKSSTQNYFIFIIDMMNSLTPEQEQQILTQQIQTQIQSYIDSIIFGQVQKKQIITLDSELVYGSFKLLSFIYKSQNKVKHSNRGIKETFTNLLQRFVFEENRIDTPKTKKSLRNKSKKILYDIVKKMVFSSEELLQIFVSKLQEPLAKGNWRKNLYNSWSLEQPRNDKKLFCGLENLAATCYINCLFQQLFMIKQFRDRFIDVNSLSYRETYEQNEIFQLQKILAYLKYGNKKSYTTRPFCQSFITYEGLPIDPTVQSDADEFLNTLMEKIETFLKATDKHYILEDTFEGKLSNQLNCEDCPHNSEKIENFSSIGLNIKNKKTLQEALDGYVEGQILDGDNAYFCEICEKKVKTLKRLCIKELPNMLVIVLKRFTYNYDEMRKIKINDELKYPQHINMKKYTSQYLLNEEPKSQLQYDYNLRGVVIHSGTSEGGHYYSFIKDKQKWFEFNDETVEQAEFKRIEEQGFGGEEKDSEFKLQKHKNAYILFYEKKNQHYSKIDSSVEMKEDEQPFEKQLSDIVITDNKNANFLAILLDHLFVRLCESISMSQFPKSKKFILLYFHTVLLRDRHHDDYLSNIYRVILVLMDDKGLCQWFLDQINHNYVKEFLIEAPRMVRYLCTGLIIHTLKITGVKNIDGLLSALIFCLGKRGMTPYTKILSYLSQFAEVREKLEKQYEFPERILNILLNKKIPTNSIIYKEKESYFGKDSSLKDKEMQFCHSSLVDCLKFYQIQEEDAFKILEQYNSRSCMKSMCQIVSKNCESSQKAQLYIKSLESKVLEDKSKREQVDQYLIMVRSLFLSSDEHPDFGQNIKQACISSLRTVIKDCDCSYMIMELTLVQINKIANRSGEFKKMWKARVLKQQKLKKCLNYWLRESDRPHFLPKSEEWKRKTINLTYNERQTLISENKVHQQRRTKWMLEEQQEDNPDIYSEVDETEIGKQVIVGFKNATIVEHLGILTKVQTEKQTRWAVIEKNEIDLYSWL